MPAPERRRLPRVRCAAVLLARAAVTGAADGEMQRLAAALAAAGVLEAVRHAYSEQGTPTLREVLRTLVDEGFDEVVLLPLLLPMEPGLRLWIARSVQRWRQSMPNARWPRIRLAPAPVESEGFATWLGDWLGAALSAPDLPAAPSEPAGTIVPPQRRRVLVCQGAPCNNAGAALVWGHLRNEQKRLNLRTTSDGVMTCKTTCLGPCGLAPVLQVFPEGTYYGGVDEAGIDRIVQEHLLNGRLVEELAYAPLPQRQHLRAPADPVDSTANGEVERP